MTQHVLVGINRLNSSFRLRIRPVHANPLLHRILHCRHRRQTLRTVTVLSA